MRAPVVLRYFDAQGRAQSLRHALADAEIPFEDIRVQTADWASHKNDPDFAGSFGSLPTLSWDGAVIAETLPIASFLARRLGHYSGIDDARVAVLEGVSSCCYLEVGQRVGELLWADVLYPGADRTKALPRLLVRMLDKLSRVEALLPRDRWLGGEKPTVADFFAAEAAEVMQYILGPDRLAPLRSRLPLLFAHAERIRMRPAILRAWGRRPPNFTASPTEQSAVERLRSLDLSAVVHA
jgi:glutathione S-transferase